jgi:hypothetical protein
MDAAELRAPRMMDKWLLASEMISEPLLISAGRVVELVAKPIANTMAAGCARAGPSNDAADRRGGRAPPRTLPT